MASRTIYFVFLNPETKQQLEDSEADEQNEEHSEPWGMFEILYVCLTITFNCVVCFHIIIFIMHDYKEKLLTYLPKDMSGYMGGYVIYITSYTCIVSSSCFCADSGCMVLE